MNDSFSALHPALTFCYFAAVLLLTMLVLHPVFLALSLLGALGYCAVLRGWRSLGRTLGRLVPFLVLMAVLNALFNHAGVTMLFYLPNGNPVTREALCYGAAAAAMFAAVILWFQCCNVVMTAEKYLYVFGSALPGVSLLLSMALRFVPKFSAHIRAVRAAQASLGCGTREGSAWQRLKSSFAFFFLLWGGGWGGGGYGRVFFLLPLGGWVCLCWLSGGGGGGGGWGRGGAYPPFSRGGGGPGGGGGVCCCFSPFKTC